jgi:hypothetical protein
LLDRLRTGLDVEGVLGDFLRDTQHFCWALRKHVPIALQEVGELAFLFRIQAGPDLHSFAWVLDINMHGLGVLVRLENAGCWRHHWAERCRGQLEVELP